MEFCLKFATASPSAPCNGVATSSFMASPDPFPLALHLEPVP